MVGPEVLVRKHLRLVSAFELVPLDRPFLLKRPSAIAHLHENDRLLSYFRACYLLEDLEFDFDRRISAFSLS